MRRVWELMWFATAWILTTSPLTQSEVLEEAASLFEVARIANLTESELKLLPDLRWGRPVANFLNRTTVRGIPEGVDCQRKSWCDGLTCTEVCERGTVRLEPWFRSAMKSQIALARELPLCYAQWLGSHNSGITLADGYGNRDRYYTELLQLTKWAGADSVFKTHNQWFSLTDQLDMGVRLLELDVHWVKGALRIAHCGGVSSLALDYISSLVNVVARLLHSSFRWDTETLGCYPSGSSIAAEDQRTLLDAMEEVAAWLYRPDNHDEFLLILLDDQLDLALWNKLRPMRQELTKFIPSEHIFTPLDMAAEGRKQLPSAANLLRRGKRVMFLSTQYYSDLATRSFLFYNHEGRICNWLEPHLTDLDLEQCTILSGDRHSATVAMSGETLRIQVCEIQYGPLPCNLEWGKNDDVLDTTTLEKMVECGINFPSPDSLTPERAKAAIWSWAPGNPVIGRDSNFNPHLDTVIHAKDGLWRSTDASLTDDLPIVCRPCKAGYLPGVPRHGKENARLQELLLQEGIQAAKLLMPDSLYATPAVY